MVFWFSSALKVDSDVIAGEISLTFVTAIVTSLVTVSMPSVNVNVIE